VNYKNKLQIKILRLIVLTSLLILFGVTPTGASPVSSIINVAAGDVVGLIAAINAANTNNIADTIELAPGTYTLTTVDNSTDGANGLPVISSDIAINGNGATITRDNAAPSFRIFYVESGGSLTIEDLTISNGVNFNGSGIYTKGILTIADR